MSSTPVVPTPNSSSLLRHVPRLTARARAMLTAMNLHFAGVAALAVITLYLVIHLFFVWNALKALNADALNDQHNRLRVAEVAAKPLRGLDAKVARSTEEADTFSDDRLPYAYSQVAAELGVLTKREGVRLTRVQYAQAPALSGDDALTEVKMDASVSGDYRPVVQFLNALERDDMFFVISGINITGQQTGQVNLRVRLTTYLRLPDLEESKTEMPATDAPAAGGTP